LATGEILVPPGVQQWVEWPVNLVGVPDGYVRLELGPNPEVGWCASGTFLPGQVSMYRMGNHPRMRAIFHPLAFRVAPAQAVYGPENVVSGETRPHRGVNLWRSDAGQPLPQWVELAWAKPQTIRHVELSFPGQLVAEVHAYPPFYRDPQCPRDYRIEGYRNGAWHTLIEAAGNYQRHRRHALQAPVDVEKLRVVVLATNGDPSAAIYEVRCYA
ncbi:MAG: hypothetical protein J0L75_12130, partial [Spirochaetes bacterium]|nr:hypothetical protein [Spirochaetota bacterium]